MEPRTHRLIAAFLTLGATAAPAAEIDFNRDIRPILSENCFHCHGPDPETREADLRLDSYEGAIEDRDGARAVDPADPAASELIFRILEKDKSEVMPPPKSHKKLTPRQIALLQEWVKSGAAYDTHWAFVPPARPALPRLAKQKASLANPIDSFVLEKLDLAGLEMAPEAQRETLIRRVAFDLTGLPPTPEEVDAFVNDSSPGAYEKLVDRLLASEHYGERMALAWMDAARYGDTSVMHADGPRDMWPWRDWVIKAYNANMPFDQFTVEQLAGDLLPDPTVDQKVASGFNRNHASSDEGGAIAEELRVEYVVDRVKTTSNVWMALSVECSQCHSHKFDPISQKDYYAFYAFFNNTTDPGMQSRRGNQAPIVEVASPAQATALAGIRGARDTAQKKIAAHKKAARAPFDAWLTELASRGPDALPEPGGIAHHFAFAPEKKTLTDRVSNLAPARDPGFTAAAGTRRNAIALDGKTTADFDSFPVLERNEEFTFAAWVYLPADTSGAVFARMDVAQGHRGYDFWVQGRQIGTHIINTWPGNALKVVSETKLPLKKWQHVAVTYDGSSKARGVKIYVNGALTKNKVEKDTLRGTIEAESPFRIGGRSRGALPKLNADDLRIYHRALELHEIQRLGSNPIGKLLALPAGKRSKKDTDALFNYYLTAVDETFPRMESEVARLNADEEKLKKAVPTSMIMQDNAEPRMTYMLSRGQYDQPIEDEVIEPAVPVALGALPDEMPRNRLGLARWLTQPDHPLTARVAVNRYWTLLFGEGLVRTVMDFGNQGEPPTHPELLDWLAVDFTSSGWDVKRMIKQMVLSATYRQSSRLDPALSAVDPENRLLARGPRFRLQGEFIRDNALAVSGLLVGSVGGPGVKPYQPAGLWNEVSLSKGLFFTQDKGEKLYRRSMYIYWKRSAPHPAMLIFDAPTREKCVVQRPRTNTPLQALVTLNEVQFVEASRHLAERLFAESGDDFASRIDYAFQLCTARRASPEEIAVCREVYEKQRASFAAEPGRAAKYLAQGDSKRDESIDPVEHAAWTVITNMILNLDEVLTRG